jgi:hypothetical protein
MSNTMTPAQVLAYRPRHSAPLPAPRPDYAYGRPDTPPVADRAAGLQSRGFRRIAHGRRHVRGEMNSTERAYADHLKQRELAGEVVWWRFEEVTLTVMDPPNAVKARFTPDFMVMLANGELEVHEVKGFMEGDALAKLKACAERYPFRVIVARRRAKGDGGGWDVEEM